MQHTHNNIYRIRKSGHMFTKQFVYHKDFKKKRYQPIVIVNVSPSGAVCTVARTRIVHRNSKHWQKLYYWKCVANILTHFGTHTWAASLNNMCKVFLWNELEGRCFGVYFVSICCLVVASLLLLLFTMFYIRHIFRRAGWVLSKYARHKIVYVLITEISIENSHV